MPKLVETRCPLCGVEEAEVCPSSPGPCPAAKMPLRIVELPPATADLHTHPSARITPQMVLDKMQHRVTRGEIKAIMVTYLTPDGEARVMWSEMAKSETCFLHMMQEGIIFGALNGLDPDVSEQPDEPA